MKVYLCGAINGCTDEQCKDWRESAKKRLPDTIDPLRRDYRGCEDQYSREIVSGDKEDIRKSDALLVNHPGPSSGTDMEMFFAFNLGLLVVTVVPEGTRISPWVREHSSRIVHTFEEALSILCV